MRGYNRRFAAMARERRRNGTFGRSNARQRDLFPGFNFRVPYLLKVIAGGLAGWAWLELTEGWRSWGRRKQEVVEQPAVVAGREVLDYAVTR